jgi:hypothetical protein
MCCWRRRLLALLEEGDGGEPAIDRGLVRAGDPFEQAAAFSSIWGEKRRN